MDRGDLLAGRADASEVGDRVQRRLPQQPADQRTRGHPGLARGAVRDRDEVGLDGLERLDGGPQAGRRVGVARREELEEMVGRSLAARSGGGGRRAARACAAPRWRRSRRDRPGRLAPARCGDTWPAGHRSLHRPWRKHPHPREEGGCCGVVEPGLSAALDGRRDGRPHDHMLGNAARPETSESGTVRPLAHLPSSAPDRAAGRRAAARGGAARPARDGGRVRAVVSAAARGEGARVHGGCAVTGRRTRSSGSRRGRTEPVLHRLEDLRIGDDVVRQSLGRRARGITPSVGVGLVRHAGHCSPGPADAESPQRASPAGE